MRVCRLQGTLKQGFTTLRESLVVAMAAVDCEGTVVGEEELCEGVKEVEGLSALFWRVCESVETLARGRRRRKKKGYDIGDTSDEEEEEEAAMDSRTSQEDEEEVGQCCTSCE